MKLTPLDFALKYAAAGFPVVPMHNPVDGKCSCGNPDCESVGKHPRIKLTDPGPTTDRVTIRRYWTKWPDANIAIALEQLVAVDLDPRNGGDLGNLPDKLPKTCWAKTGGGGQHFLYRTLICIDLSSFVLPGAACW